MFLLSCHYRLHYRSYKSVVFHMTEPAITHIYSYLILYQTGSACSSLCPRTFFYLRRLRLFNCSVEVFWTFCWKNLKSSVMKRRPHWRRSCSLWTVNWNEPFATNEHERILKSHEGSILIKNLVVGNVAQPKESFQSEVTDSTQGIMGLQADG